MKKIIFIKIFCLIGLNLFSQFNYYELHGIDEFINYYSETYGSSQIACTDSMISTLNNDSLNYILQSIQTKIHLWNIVSKLLIGQEIYDYNALLAILSYNELLNRDIRNKQVYYYGASLKSGLGYHKNAIQDYTSALKHNNPFHINDYRIMGKRGEAKYEINDYYGAISDLNIAIDSILIDNIRMKEYKTSLIFYLIARGRSNFQIKKYEKALSDFSKVLEIDAEYSEGYYYRGLTYLVLERTELGCTDLSRAGERGIEKAYNLIEKYCNN